MYHYLLMFCTLLAHCHCLRALSQVSDPVWRIRTLDECEKENKTFCFTGMYSDEDARPKINRFVSTHSHVLKHFQTYRMHGVSRTTQKLHHRFKRDLTLNDTVPMDAMDNSTAESGGLIQPHVDCSSVCCVTEDMTPPFSHIKDNDGWQQVASTPEFPQRVSFYTETCTKHQAPCAGVKSMDDTQSSRCVQFYRHHAIAVFNKTTGLTFRYIEVPVTCKCVLGPPEQEISPLSPTLAILKILQSSTVAPMPY